MNQGHPLVVTIEGMDLGTGIIVGPGALYLEDDAVPVTWENVSNEILGYARNLRRDSYNVIMDIYLKEDVPLDLDDRIVGSVFAQPFTAHAEPNPLTGVANQVVSKARVRAVTLQEKE